MNSRSITRLSKNSKTIEFHIIKQSNSCMLIPPNFLHATFKKPISKRVTLKSLSMTTPQRIHSLELFQPSNTKKTVISYVIHISFHLFITFNHILFTVSFLCFTVYSFVQTIYANEIIVIERVNAFHNKKSVLHSSEEIPKQQIFRFLENPISRVEEKQVS